MSIPINSIQFRSGEDDGTRLTKLTYLSANVDSLAKAIAKLNGATISPGDISTTLGVLPVVTYSSSTILKAGRVIVGTSPITVGAGTSSVTVGLDIGELQALLTLPFSSITDTPITFAGYGLPDAALASRLINTAGGLIGGGDLSADRTISISGSYPGQVSIDTLGTVTTGAWNASTIAISHGGTGQISASAAFNALSPITTTGDIIYSSGGAANTRLGIGSSGQVLTVSGGVPSWQTPSGGTVTSVSGTANRITSTGGIAPVIDIAATYVGQASITTLGTVTTGVWHGTAIDLSTYSTGILPSTSFPALTGDITTVSGSVATTLATVNSNVGSFGDSTHVAAFTVNGKGLTTAASSVAIAFPVTSVNSATGAVVLTKSDVGLSNVTNDAQVKLSTVTAKGDLIAGTASATVAALGVGTNGFVLTADSTQATGIKWAASSAGTAANPTASVGLTAVNGSATTYMRSDAAPPIDVSIAPTWTGVHIHTPASGVAVTINAVGGVSGLIVNGSSSGGIATFTGFDSAHSVSTYKSGATTVGQIGDRSAISGGAALDFAIRAGASLVLTTGGSSERLVIDGFGKATINAPSSGTALTVTSVSTSTAIAMGDGAVATPGLSFIGDTDSGIYRIGANNIGIGVNGAKVLDISITGLGVTGTVVASGAISGSNLSSSGGANPSASLGLTAINGSAITYMRSDAAPALDVSISPTWSGTHLFQHTQDGLFTTSFFNPSAGTHALARISLGVTAVTTPASSGLIIGASGVNNTDVLFGDAGLGTGGNVAFFYTSTTGVAGFVAAPMVFAIGDLTRIVIGPAPYPTYPDLKFMNLAESFKVIGTTTTGNAYHSYYRANGTTQKGFIGYDSNNVNDNLRIVNNESASIILASAGGTLTLNSSGNTAASGTISGTNLSASGGANPSSGIGLTVTNGSATTFMRSDAAPALSQGIIPTWTGLHVFQGNILGVSTGTTGFSIGTQSSGAIPGTMAVESSQGADGKLWEDIYNGGIYTRRLVNDAINSVTSWQVVTRSGMAVTSVAFPNSPIVLANYTVAGLPSAATVGAGATAFVTDATLGIAAGLGLTPIGGGSNKVPVYSDGSAWKIG